MRRARRNDLRWASIVALSIAAAVGCTPLPQGQEDLLRTLSSSLLFPQMTCEELRARFEVEYLELVDTPDKVGIAYEDHWVAVTDGGLVHIWYMPSKLQRGVVVLCNGNSGQMKCYLFISRLLSFNGWTVVSFDYEGFGLSTGSPSLTALAPDLDVVVDWARSRSGTEKVTVMGISLGTIPAVAVAANRPDAVNGAVLDSPVALASQLKRVPFLVHFDPQAYVDKLDPALISETEIQRVHQPVLIFLHENDLVTPPDTIERLYDNAAGPKTLVRFPDLQHALAPYVRTDEYTFHLETFLSAVWGQTPK